jgi:hypothetical protein
MMKKLLLATLLATPLAVNAHSDECDVDMDYGMKISPSKIQFYDEQSPLYSIVDDQLLYLNGQQVSLDADGQQSVSDFSKSVRELVPEVQSIAVDAVELASKGVNMAFTGLLGEDSDTVVELDDKFEQLKQELEYKFASDQEISFNMEGGDDFLGSEFEERVESLVEDAVQQSIGGLLMALGQQMLTSGGDMDAFEARMEAFGEDIEVQMEKQAEGLEQRAEQLCLRVSHIAELEDKMRANVDQIQHIKLVKVNNHQMRLM